MKNLFTLISLVSALTSAQISFANNCDESMKDAIEEAKALHSETDQTSALERLRISIDWAKSACIIQGISQVDSENLKVNKINTNINTK